MAKSKVQRPQRLVQLLFFASASTAAIISVGDTSLTLSNFQLITQLSVPLGCLLAYNSPIQGCTSSDFANGAACSAKCRRGLTRRQDTIRDACQSVQVQTNTLLGQALAGNLVNLLCPSTNGQPTSSSVQTVKPSTTIALPSTSAVVIPPAPPPSTTTRPVVIPPTTSSAAPIPPPSQPPVIPQPSSTVAPPASQPPAPPPPAPPTTIATSATTNEPSPKSTSTTATAPVNPLDALLMSGGAHKPITISRGTIYSSFLFWVFVAVRGA